MKRLITATVGFVFGMSIAVCYFANNVLASEIVQNDKGNFYEFIHSEHIRSVRLHRLGWEHSDPIIQLGSPERLLLSFDDLADQAERYSYSILHCDAHWNPSNLFVQDYLEGFEVNDITNWEYSSGTIMGYQHFKLELPNEKISFKISGNYVIRVFSTYEPDSILISKRFAVFEPIADIVVSLRQPPAGELRYSGQQLNVTVNTGQLRILNPADETLLVACKNYPFQNCQFLKQPQTARGSELNYSHAESLIFEGGNEFRQFDTRNLRYQGQGIRAIDYYGGQFHVLLRPDEARRHAKYSSFSDFNGKYAVAKEHSQNPQVEADYCWVYFNLKPPAPIDEGWGIYLFGELTNWQISPSNRLHFNRQDGVYDLALFLKQGAYNYSYLLASSTLDQVDTEIFEGSHFDTENTYILFFFYRPLGSRYDRLVGFNRINSRNPI